MSAPHVVVQGQGFGPAIIACLICRKGIEAPLQSSDLPQKLNAFDAEHRHDEPTTPNQ